MVRKKIRHITLYVANVFYWGGGGGGGDTQTVFWYLLVMYSCIGVNMLHTQILYMTFSFRLDNITMNKYSGYYIVDNLDSQFLFLAQQLKSY
jgi:hypothetical protein